MKRLAVLTTGRDGRHARAGRLLLVLAGLVSLAVLAGGCGGDDNNVTFPNQNESPIMPWYYDVFGTAADDVWVAGEAGVMYHWDGAAWTREPLGTRSAITTIWGPGDGTLYLCGHNGLVMRNSGSGWTSMTSNTSRDLYGLGAYRGQIHVVGYGGAAKRLNGSSWQDIAPTAVIRNAQAGFATTDTLNIPTEMASLLTVNHYCIGGAYRLPGWRDTDEGRTNTDGMVLMQDLPPVGLPAFDWELRPQSGDQLAPSEWVYCTTSDDLVLANNYMATSEGWLFQLVEDEEVADRLVWSKFPVRVTADRNTGIRDMWLDADGGLYMVTDDGSIIYRGDDGEFVTLYEQHDSLVGIWGASPAEFYAVGYTDQTIVRCSFDPATQAFSSELITLPFPE